MENVSERTAMGIAPLLLCSGGHISAQQSDTALLLRHPPAPGLMILTILWQLFLPEIKGMKTTRKLAPTQLQL